jgi:hypothetical protein
MSIGSRLKKAWKKVTAGIAAGVLAVLTFLGLHDAESMQPNPQDVLTWAYPTLNTDGTALPASQIARTLLVWSTVSGGPYTAGTLDVAAPALTATLTRSTVYGTRCYKAAIVATNGMQSDYTGEVCKTNTAPPNPPSGLRLE